MLQSQRLAYRGRGEVMPNPTRLTKVRCVPYPANPMPQNSGDAGGIGHCLLYRTNACHLPCASCAMPRNPG